MGPGKRTRILALVLAAAAAAAGCGRSEDAAEEEKGIILTISLPQAEWEGYAEGLSQLYMESHPQIQDIRWNLVDRSAYSEYLRVNLAAQNLPDIFSLGNENSPRQWRDQLLPLDREALKDIPEAYAKNGRVGKEMYAAPILVEAHGILYNTGLLEDCGAEDIPETWEEFSGLCQVLYEADIKPVISHYKEALLGMAGDLFLQPVSMGAEEKDWEALADFLDLTLARGNKNALTTAGDTARDYFFIQRYAMLNNEGSWMAPVIRKTASEMDGQVALGPYPLARDGEENFLYAGIMSLSVAASTPYPEEAADFLEWLARDEEASDYLIKMGCLPVSAMEGREQEELSPLARQVKEAVLSGRASCIRPGSLPEEKRKETKSIWSRYIGGELDRREAVSRSVSLWKDNTGE